MNQYARTIYDSICMIQMSISENVSSLDPVVKKYQENQESIIDSYRRQMITLDKEYRKKQLNLKRQAEKDFVYWGFLYSRCKHIIDKLSLLAPHYNKYKDNDELFNNFVYPFENIEEPVEEQELIFKRIGELSTELVIKHPLINFFGKKKLHIYQELNCLLDQSNSVSFEMTNRLVQDYYLKAEEWFQACTGLLSELDGKKEKELEQLDLELSSKKEDAKVRLRKELDQRVSSEDLMRIVMEINEQEPNFSLYSPSAHEEPIIKIGFILKKINDLDTFDHLQEIVTNRYADWVSDGLLSLPYALRFSDCCSLLIETDHETEETVHRGVQALVARMLAQLPPTTLHCTFIDPKNAGTIFSPFMRLSSKDEKIVGKQVYTSQAAINHALDEMYMHIDQVIQFKLSSGLGYSNIYQYNHYAKENAESYKLLVILDFPKNFSLDMIEKLLYIAANGPKCGVHTIVAYSDKHVSSYDKGKFKQTIERLADYAVHIRSQESELYLSPTSHGVRFDFASPPPLPQLIKFIDQLGKQVYEANKTGTPFSVIAPDTWFSKSSLHTLTVPIGRAEGNTHKLVFGVNTSHHALIAGKTGSGKTTLLHTLITSACVNYSPDELIFYLLDFKEGVEFMDYANYQIPHMKLLALESEQEFGETILKELVKELERRGTIFKEHSVQNITNYRLKTGEIMPRILLIIDEFQVLFDTQRDRTIARSCGSMMEDLVRRGRSFGIHVILASQSISSAVNSSFEPQTREQMAVRIGLKADEKDARILLGEDNYKGIARLGQETGAAIYNSDAGYAPNVLFKVAYLDKVNQEETLKAIHEHGRSKGYLYDARVFLSQSIESIEEATIPFNAPLESSKKSRTIALWLGKSNRVSPPYSMIELHSKSEDNMIIVGQDEELARKILYSSLCSVLYHFRVNLPHVTERKLIIADFSSAYKETNDAFDNLVGELQGHVDTVYGDSEVIERLDELHREMNDRKNKISRKDTPCFFFIHGVQRINALYDTTVVQVSGKSTAPLPSPAVFSLRKPTAPVDATAIPSDGYMPQPSTNTKFLELVKFGPSYGIYVIGWCDTNHNLADLTGNNPRIKTFGHRVACRLRVEESRAYLGEEYAASLKRNSALYRSPKGDFFKFQPFEFPGVNWRNSFVQKITSHVKQSIEGRLT